MDLQAYHEGLHQYDDDGFVTELRALPDQDELEKTRTPGTWLDALVQLLFCEWEQPSRPFGGESDWEQPSQPFRVKATGSSLPSPSA
jgi:hypothetical protein